MRKPNNTQTKLLGASLIRKAFISVNHVKLWNVLSKMGIPEHLIILMQSLYTGQEATV